MKEHYVIRDLLTLAASGALDAAEQERVEEHMRRCEACRAELGGWTLLIDVLKGLPTPQAPPELVLRTRRLLAAYAIAGRERPGSRLLLAFLVVFSWVVTVLTWRFVGLLDIPLARWLDVSSTIIWIVYIGATWLATVVAAGLLVKHSQQEGKPYEKLFG